MPARSALGMGALEDPLTDSTPDSVPFHEAIAALKLVPTDDDLARRALTWLRGKGEWPAEARPEPTDAVFTVGSAADGEERERVEVGR